MNVYLLYKIIKDSEKGTTSRIVPVEYFPTEAAASKYITLLDRQIPSDLRNKISHKQCEAYVVE